MLKKAIIGSFAAVALSALVFGKDVFSYAHTAWSTTRDAVRQEVPLEFQVQRARSAVAQLEPAIHSTLKAIAEQQVDIEHLNKEIARRGDDMQQQKQAVLTLRTDLESGQPTFHYARLTFTADQVRRDLRLRFERFKTAEALLGRDQQILEAREKALAAREHTLDNMLNVKKDLEAEVEQLDARLQTVRAEQTVASPEIDESALSNAKRLIVEVNKQLDVQEKLLDAEGKFVGLIPVESKVTTADASNLTAEIDSYFKKAPAEKPVQAQKPTSSVAKTDGPKG
jgi:peptidoglycan hydrolase CwlO-like protein